jgi:hypothetical protein
MELRNLPFRGPAPRKQTVYSKSVCHIVLLSFAGKRVTVSGAGISVRISEVGLVLNRREGRFLEDGDKTPSKLCMLLITSEAGISYFFDLVQSRRADHRLSREGLCGLVVVRSHSETLVS